MKTFQAYRTICSSAAAMLILLCLASAGCDEMAGSVMEVALEKGSGSASPNSMAAKLKAEQALCPRKLNDHTTLESVSLKGVNRIKYLYRVTESGRPEVNMTRQSKIRREVIERAKTSHLGPSIVKLKLGVDHIFEDADGKCLLWLEMTSNDFEGIGFEKPGTETTLVSTVKSPEKSVDVKEARKTMLANLQEEMAQCPREINEHTTLKKVYQKGTNRIKYLYVVSDAGRGEVNMNTESEVHQQVVERTKSSPLGKSIIDLDLGIEHFFQDKDGRCMLWLQMTKNDFLTSVVATAEPSEEEVVAETEAAKANSSIPTFNASFPESFQQLLGTDDNAVGVQSNPYVK